MRIRAYFVLMIVTGLVLEHGAQAGGKSNQARLGAHFKTDLQKVRRYLVGGQLQEARKCFQGSKYLNLKKTSWRQEKALTELQDLLQDNKAWKGLEAVRTAINTQKLATAEKKLKSSPTLSEENLKGVQRKVRKDLEAKLEQARVWAGQENPTNKRIPAKAKPSGKNWELLRVLYVPRDKATYGRFADYGRWDNPRWGGYSGLPVGHWVWVNGYWYIWGKKTRTASTTHK